MNEDDEDDTSCGEDDDVHKHQFARGFGPSICMHVLQPKFNMDRNEKIVSSVQDDTKPQVQLKWLQATSGGTPLECQRVVQCIKDLALKLEKLLK